MLVFVALACAPQSEVAQSDLDAAVERIDQLEAQVTALQAQTTALQAGLDAAAATPRARVIQTDTTIAIPGDYPDVSAALASLGDAVIASPAWVTLQVADGTYDATNAIAVDHRDGQRIAIVGNTADPSKVVLRFTGTTEGLFVVRGRALGQLAGVTIRGVTSQEGAPGVWVAESSALRCGAGVIVEGWSWAGIVADYNSSVRCDGAIARNNGGEGFLANRGSSLRARQATASGNAAHGFSATGAANADVRQSEAIDNGTETWQAGFYAAGAAMLVADETTATGGSGWGYQAGPTSGVRAWASTAAENATGGFSATDGGWIWAGNGAIARDNGGVGLLVLRGASAVTWGGITITGGSADGIQVGGSSSLALQQATIEDNGEFGVNTFWGSYTVVDSETTVSGHTWNYNVGPGSDPTSTSYTYR